MNSGSSVHQKSQGVPSGIERWDRPPFLFHSLFILAIVLVVIFFRWFKAASPYEDSFQIIKNSSRVIEAVGEPVKPSWLVGGSIHFENFEKKASIHYSIKGPKGSGKVSVNANRRKGPWNIYHLECVLKGREGALTLTPSEGKVYLARGAALWRKGDLSGALADYIKAVELDPSLVKIQLADPVIPKIDVPFLRSVKKNLDEGVKFPVAEAFVDGGFWDNDQNGIRDDLEFLFRDADGNGLPYFAENA